LRARFAPSMVMRGMASASATATHLAVGAKAEATPKGEGPVTVMA
jgi:hypothetical protein